MGIEEILSIPLMLSLSWMLGSSLDVVFAKRLDKDGSGEAFVD